MLKKQSFVKRGNESDQLSGFRAVLFFSLTTWPGDLCLMKAILPLMLTAVSLIPKIYPDDDSWTDLKRKFQDRNRNIQGEGVNVWRRTMFMNIQRVDQLLINVCMSVSYSGQASRFHVNGPCKLWLSLSRSSNLSQFSQSVSRPEEANPLGDSVLTVSANHSLRKPREHRRPLP